MKENVCFGVPLALAALYCCTDIMQQGLLDLIVAPAVPPLPKSFRAAAQDVVEATLALLVW